MSPSMKLVVILFACLTQALLAGGRNIRSDLDYNDNKFADRCDLSNETSTIDPNEVFKCRSGHVVTLAALCDAHNDCTDMDDEYGCVDCINRYNEDGLYPDDSRICIQNQYHCKCVPLECYEEGNEKQYQLYSDVTTHPSRNSGNHPITHTTKVCGLLILIILSLCAFLIVPTKICPSNNYNL